MFPLLEVRPNKIDQVFGQFMRRTRNLIRRKKVKSYMVFQNLGHQITSIVLRLCSTAAMIGLIFPAAAMSRPTELTPSAIP